MTEWKSPEGQDYRDWMAKKIRERRASWEDDVAYTLLQEAKKVGDYYKSLRPDRLKKQKVRIEAVYSMIENWDEEFIAENLNKWYLTILYFFLKSINPNTARQSITIGKTYFPKSFLILIALFLLYLEFLWIYL